MQFATSHPYLLAAIVGFISSLTAVFCRGALYGIPALWVVTIEFLVATATMVLVTHPATIRRLWRSPSKNGLLLLGLLQAISSIFYVYGVSHSTATNALFLTKVLPYWVLFWQFALYRTKVSRGEFALLLVHVFGAWVLSTNGNITTPSVHQLGDVLLVIGMMGAALATVVSQHLVHGLAARDITLASMLFGSVILLSTTLIVMPPLPPLYENFTQYKYLALNSIGFAAIIFLALVALKSGKAWKVTALRALGPLLGLPFAVWLLDEKITLGAIVGGALVLSTSVIMVIERKKRD